MGNKKLIATTVAFALVGSTAALADPPKADITLTGFIQSVTPATGKVRINGVYVVVGRDSARQIASLAAGGAPVDAVLVVSGETSGDRFARLVSYSARPSIVRAPDSTTLSSFSPGSVAGSIGTGIQGSIGTGIQGSIGTGIQGSIGTGIQGSIGTGIL